MKKYDVAIIGGGAAGLMAAIWASKNGKSVILLEKNETLGRKILATGNGRCNLTNRYAEANNYHGANKEFIENVLDKFTPGETIKFFESLGVILKEEDRGRIFPRTNEAQTIVSALTHEIANFDITVLTNTNVRGFKKNDLWKINLQNKGSIEAKRIIVSCGGQSAPQLGTSGDGYYWLEKLGHTIIPARAALTPIETETDSIKDVQGLRIEGQATIMAGNKIVAQKDGDILFTHFGLSGPAIMALAREINPQENLKISIDLFPETNINDLDQKVKLIFDQNGAKSLKNSLSGIVPSSFALAVLKKLNLNETKKTAEISKQDRLNIVNNFKNFQLDLKGLRSFKESQVTAGGVSANEVNPQTMQSKIIPGLFFAGEILDVDGDSGGFNLQWAWSTGFIAGNNV